MDRIVVLVIGYGEEKLPNVSDGTEGETGPSSIDLVQEHHVPERMKGVSLDTSASNTETCLPSILAPYISTNSSWQRYFSLQLVIPIRIRT